MKLPDKKYYSISDIVKRWNSRTNETFEFQDVLEHVRQGILPIKTYNRGKYYDISKSLLSFFDLRYIDTSSITNLGNLSIKDLNNPEVTEFEDNHETKIELKLKDIYVHISDLLRFENSYSATPNMPVKALDTKELNSLSIIILSLASLAKIDLEKGKGAPKKIADESERLGNKLSEGTIRAFLKTARELLPPLIK